MKRRTLIRILYLFIILVVTNIINFTIDGFFPYKFFLKTSFFIDGILIILCYVNIAKYMIYEIRRKKEDKIKENIVKKQSDGSIL